MLDRTVHHGAAYPDDPLYLRLACSTGAPDRYLDEILRRHDLCFREWLVLATAIEYGALPQCAIVQHTGLHKIAVNRACKALQRQGHVATVLDPFDRRLRVIQALPAGMERYARTRAEVDEACAHIFGSCTAQELSLAEQSLSRLERAALDAMPFASPAFTAGPNMAPPSVAFAF